jgi:hypothetical protein
MAMDVSTVRNNHAQDRCLLTLSRQRVRSTDDAEVDGCLILSVSEKQAYGAGTAGNRRRHRKCTMGDGRKAGLIITAMKFPPKYLRP